MGLEDGLFSSFEVQGDTNVPLASHKMTIWEILLEELATLLDILDIGFLLIRKPVT